MEILFLSHSPVFHETSPLFPSLWPRPEIADRFRSIMVIEQTEDTLGKDSEGLSVQ